MRTVSEIDRWFDEHAEDLLGLPVAEAILDVMSAGLHVELARPRVHRVRDGAQSGVCVVADRRGVVVDVRKLDAGPAPVPPVGPRPFRPLRQPSVAHSPNLPGTVAHL